MTTKIGFWWSSKEPNLPFPEKADKPWVGSGRFSELLAKHESTLEPATYRGWSTCRLCGKANGSSEFSSGGFVWPEGLSHYVTDHNVRPPGSFVSYILDTGSNGFRKRKV